MRREESIRACEAASRELDRQFGAAPVAISAETAAHLKDCPQCRELFAWARGAEQAALPEETVEACVVQRIVSRISGGELKPVKPLPSLAISVMQFLSVLVVLMAALAGVWAVEGVLKMPSWRSAAMLGLAGLGAVLFSIAVAWKMRPGARCRFSEGPAMGLLTLVLVGGFAALFPWEEFGGGAGRGFALQGWSCFWPGVAMAVPVAGMLWLVARRGACTSLPGLGAALGALGGLFGLAALELSCANDDAAHLIVWHVGVLVMAAALGGVAGSIAAKVAGRDDSPDVMEGGQAR